MTRSATHPGQATISVALCTYNGEQFLQQQLATIRSQTRPPDELVVFDDRSTDRTPEIVAAFARTVDFPVRFSVNAVNLGSTRNFEQAILACKGELIALCDQDDLWYPHRLEHSERTLLDHPDAGLVFSDGDLIDDAGHKLGVTLWEHFGFDAGARELLQAGDYRPMTRRMFVTGATVMLRARFATACFPTGRHWLHDGWLAMLIACSTGIRLIEEPLIAYRVHAAQQVGLGSGPASTPESNSLARQAERHWSTLGRFLATMDEICNAIDRLPLTQEQKQEGAAAAFARHRDFLRMRLALPASRWQRLPYFLDGLDQYRESAMGPLSIAKDLILPKEPGG